jgi:hypothetical protein
VGGISDQTGLKASFGAGITMMEEELVALRRMEEGPTRRGKNNKPQMSGLLFELYPFLGRYQAVGQSEPSPSASGQSSQGKVAPKVGCTLEEEEVLQVYAGFEAKRKEWGDALEEHQANFSTFFWWCLDEDAHWGGL